jgi:hypothetical protein
MACFEVISRHMPGRTEANCKNVCHNSRCSSADSNLPNMGVLLNATPTRCLLLILSTLLPIIIIIRRILSDRLVFFNREKHLLLSFMQIFVVILTHCRIIFMKEGPTSKWRTTNSFLNFLIIFMLYIPRH